VSELGGVIGLQEKSGRRKGRRVEERKCAR